MDIPALFKFLKGLKKNNNKEWFEKHREEYNGLRKEFTALVNEIIQELAKADPEIANLEAKDCIFRINRDIRFSKDKTPYKTNFGASIAPGGKKGVLPGYYLHLEPGASFLAGGKYMPDAQELKKIRQEIDYNGEQLEKILKGKNFKKYFGEMYQEDKLTNPPKEYNKTHPQIELLKLKSFIVVHDMGDEVVASKDFKKYYKKIYAEMLPLNHFLREALSS
ncbi:MAG TPA: DUF2461 domain-containing protein [Cytophagaceae bacterium]